MIQVNNYGTGNTGDLSGIGFGAGAGNAYIKGSIGFIRTDSYGQGDFTFNLNTDSSSALVNDTDELVRIQKGGGISFNGDTAAANALDDYEEGLHTVTGTGSSSTTSLTFYEDKLSYVKIGNNCWLWGRIRINSDNYSGDFRISLPFAAAAGTSCSNCAQSSVSTHGMNFENDGVGTGHNMGLHIETVPGTSLAYFIINRDNAAWIAAGSSHIAQYHYLAFTHIYRTT